MQFPSSPLLQSIVIAAPAHTQTLKLSIWKQTPKHSHSLFLVCQDVPSPNSHGMNVSLDDSIPNIEEDQARKEQNTERQKLEEQPKTPLLLSTMHAPISI